MCTYHAQAVSAATVSPSRFLPSGGPNGGSGQVYHLATFRSPGYASNTPCFTPNLFPWSVQMSTDPARDLTRRGFLQAGAAATLGLAASAADARQAQQPDPFGGFTVGVQSYSFRNFNLEQTLERIRD